MTVQQIALLVTPPALLISTQITFRWAGRTLGPRWGYLCGFLSYWGIWCLAVPWRLLGKQGIAALFVVGTHLIGQPMWVGAVLLSLPLLLGYGYAFPRVVRGADLTLLVASAALAAINAVLEELLWRGAYIATFHDSWLLGVAYPAVGFGIWHLSPQVIHPNPAPGGKLSFVAVSVVIGLMWGWVAFAASSILMTSIVHLLFDFSGLGARVYLRYSEGKPSPAT